MVRKTATPQETAAWLGNGLVLFGQTRPSWFPAPPPPTAAPESPAPGAELRGPGDQAAGDRYAVAEDGQLFMLNHRFRFRRDAYPVRDEHLTSAEALIDVAEAFPPLIWHLQRLARPSLVRGEEEATDRLDAATQQWLLGLDEKVFREEVVQSVNLWLDGEQDPVVERDFIVKPDWPGAMAGLFLRVIDEHQLEELGVSAYECSSWSSDPCAYLSKPAEEANAIAAKLGLKLTFLPDPDGALLRQVTTNR